MGLLGLQVLGSDVNPHPSMFSRLFIYKTQQCGFHWSPNGTIFCSFTSASEVFFQLVFLTFKSLVG